MVEDARADTHCRGEKVELMRKDTPQSDLSRETILQRIRTALPRNQDDVAIHYAQIVRPYRREARLDRSDCLELFIDRLLDYDTEIVQIDDESGIAAAITELMSRRGEQSLLAPEDFPATWLPSSSQIVRDAALTTAQVEAQEVVVTTCEAAIASTGTIVLVHGKGQGRRTLTLLPDHHICLVKRNQIFETVPEALARVQINKSKPITTISGPSATSDIEMTRIRGVHGPRQLSVILYG
jgi:L-lactate dehydrogenase complex protein LldG